MTIARRRWRSRWSSSTTEEPAIRRESDMHDDIELVPEEELPELALMIDLPS
ncbi:hypothetical protein [Embleya scabrispora]|uniref:hypothetical protein n=1 Tax=Embleya scabrispora TaxID=159449 RepID=UPI001319C576|nr:hypothetical protein [Embleya scabrispora]MYS81521.1 hypothetical protein [Streptomyces sp. SID5474]